MDIKNWKERLKHIQMYDHKYLEDRLGTRTKLDIIPSQELVDFIDQLLQESIREEREKFVEDLKSLSSEHYSADIDEYCVHPRDVKDLITRYSPPQQERKESA